MQGENADLLRDFSFRLETRAEKVGLSQSQIAAKLGTNTSRVNHWFSGRNFPRVRERMLLAELLGVNLEWLVKGEGDVEKSAFAVHEDQSIYTAVREVPVISWTHAGAAATFEEMPKHFQGRVATNSRDPRAFALTIEGDSMEPRFLQGDKVICEPSQQPSNGRPVVAKFVNDAVQLRIYTKLPNKKIRLAPYNAVYPTIEHSEKEFHWIFPVRELVRSV